MTARGVTVRAHAKVNLLLRILERQPNGYHVLETIFQRLALADDVTVTVGTGDRSLRVIADWGDGRPPSLIELGAPEDNLGWRAAAAYAEAARWPGGWHIEIVKRIPIGAGLGGGSADAAAVLCALDRLATAPLGADRLGEIGSRLGADVAFFVSGRSTALGRGRGDRLFPMPPLAPAEVLLAVPAFGVSTAEAYQTLAAARKASGTPAGAPTRDLDARTGWEAMATLQANDFEPTIFHTYPELRRARDIFADAGATIARLSGSGSVVFGVWPGPARAPGITLPRSWRLLRTTTA